MWQKKVKRLLPDTRKISAYSEGGRGALLLEAAELELVLGSSAIPPPSRNMVTAISRLLLHASNICLPTLSVAPKRELDIGIVMLKSSMDETVMHSYKCVKTHTMHVSGVTIKRGKLRHLVAYKTHDITHYKIRVK